MGQHIINTLNSSPLNPTCIFGTESQDFIYHIPTWQSGLLSRWSSWLHQYTYSGKNSSLCIFF